MMSEGKDEVVKCLKSCILSRKGGVPSNELNDDYKELVGTDIPYAKLGHQSLADLLRSVPGVHIDARTGLVSTAPTENTAHLHQMISKQKDKPKKFKKTQKYRKYESVGKENIPYKYNHYGSNFQNKNIGKYQPKKYQQRYEPYEPYKPHEVRPTPTIPSYYNEFAYYNQLLDQYVQQCDFYDVDYNLDRSFFINQSFTASDVYCEDDFYKSEEPIIIGDDLLLDVFDKPPSSFCHPGMTIKGALLAVRQYGCAANVLINVGSVDILKGRTAHELILDMRELIQTIRQRGGSVVLSTLAPLPGIRRNLAAIAAVNAFNRWVVTEGATVARYLDVNRLFKRGAKVLYEKFDMHAQWFPNDFLWPLFYWSKPARQAVRDSVERILNETQC